MKKALSFLLALILLCGCVAFGDGLKVSDSLDYLGKIEIAKIEPDDSSSDDEPLDKDKDTVPAAQTVHYYGPWHYLSKGEHIAECLFDGCGTKYWCACSELSADYNGTTLSVCPICGHIGDEDGELLRSTTKVYNYSNAPIGDTCVYRYDAPVEDENVICLLSVVMEYFGRIEDYDGNLIPTVYIDLEGDFSLVRLTQEGAVELPCTYDTEAGTLSFDMTGDRGLFLLIAG